MRTDSVSMMVKRALNSMKLKVSLWLRQGVTPRRLALTLSLGFAIGCIPILGIPTGLCALLAVILRLNLPAIQAANYAVMPLQVALIVPFVRLGGKLFGMGAGRSVNLGALIHSSPLHVISQMGGLAGQALLAWLVLAVPAVALMTWTLTVVLRKIPAVAAAEAGD